MDKCIPFLLLFLLLSLTSIAQTYIEPIIGYGKDLNNDFSFLNTGVQCALPTKSGHEVIIKLEKGFGRSNLSSDSSITLNTQLPLYAKADKKIQPSIFSLSTGLRLKVAGARSNNIFSALMFAGLSYQKLKVTYQYDKGNYVILNPDRTEERLGVYISGGVEYMRLLKHGRLFFQVLAATPPTGRKSKYPSSFSFVAPLTFNAGYAIPLANH